ncbi:T9SS type A sorting domain-containing protein [Microvirga sp. STS02]|uniref:T9SS type A sorting domain-containing protein n=1 Tax=Hymenobacter negativus TaxID=2795026 RepID=UPI0018DB6F11|nr:MULTISPECIES: T9SS type A sorting domain-containing protein [Bacteria]MBH8570084.1 T9SS type A sorting domain-containing protein [Hymenobacter negativus]MBR7209824.1 T9SS type A sorting domain-containing protein [Microvirga sp. STS02]
MKYVINFISRSCRAGALLLAGWLSTPMAQAQTPAPLWQSALVVGGGSSNLSIKSTTSNLGGDLYVAGSFSGIVTIGGTTMISAGGTDGFVAKWSPTTNAFVWAYRFGGSDLDQVTAVALSGTRVYVAGTFISPTAAFGSTNLTNYGSATSITTDAFVARLTDAGSSATVDWAQQFGGSSQDVANTLAVAGNSVFVGGQFASATAQFGSVSQASSNAGVGYDGFVVKLTDGPTSATVSWVQAITGSGSKYVNALALNGANVYATGSIGGPNATFGTTTVPNGGASNAFLAKLNDAGSSSTWQWALRANGSGSDQSNALVVNGPVIYIAGTMSSTALVMGSHTIANAGPNGTTDAFVAAVQDAGSTAVWSWARQAGGTADDKGTGLALYGTSGVYLAGSFASSTVTIGGTTLAAGSGGALVARLSDDGPSATVDWSQRGGSVTNTMASCLTMSGTRMYMTGSFQNTATFGSQTLNSSSAGSSTNFLAHLVDPAALTTTATTSALSSSDFALYPNPAHGTSTLTLPALPGTAAATLTLRDAMGRALRTLTVTLPTAGLRHEMSLAGLPAGIYAVQVQAGQNTAARRLVVE